MTTGVVPGAQSKPRATSFVAMLRHHAVVRPQETAFVFLNGGEEEGARLSFADLDRNARSVAGFLQERGLAGERVLLQYPPGLDFVIAFFACLYARVVAIPAYPPKSNRSLFRLQAIIDDAQAKAVLTSQKIADKIRAKSSELPLLKGCMWLTTDDFDPGRAHAWRETEVKRDQLAFLQYTSGSLGKPKGVMVSHGNLVYNAHMAMLGFGHSEQTVFVGWLPLFHDMGLIGNLLQPVYLGIQSVLMAPAAFIQKPFRWLKAITDYRATTSGAPDSAFIHCVHKITPEQKASLDLRCWDLAFCGAEPVRAQTIKHFCAAFADCGFDPRAFYPCYGMAEATLFVSGGLKGRGPVLKDVHGPELERHRAVAAKNPDQARTLVSCGRTWMEQRIAIVDPQTCLECPDGTVGEIWVRGPHIAAGYWNRPQETEHAFGARLVGDDEGPYLRTGDLGFQETDQLFVTGRLKNLIIIRGRNHYPQDIEQTVAACHQSLVPDSGAAFSVEVAGEERLVVVQEVKRSHRRKLDAAEVFRAVRVAVAEDHDLQVFAVVLLKTSSIPRTTSGKIRHKSCREQFLNNRLHQVGCWRENIESQSEKPSRSIQNGKPQKPDSVDTWLLERVAIYTDEPLEAIDPDCPLNRHGLDSLKMMQLRHDVEGRFGVVLTPSRFFEDLTPKDLASEIEASAGKLEDDLLTPCAKPGIGAAVSLSAGQEALWFAQQFQPKSCALNVFFAVEIQSPLCSQRLRQCFLELVDHHPILRTLYPLKGGRMVAVVQSRERVDFVELDGVALSAEAFHGSLQAEAYRPFDLERGPLIRASLFRRPGDRHVLLISAHHIAVDLASLIVVTEELADRYQRETPKKADDHGSRQYDFYVGWQERLLASPRGTELWQYWQSQVPADPKAFPFPTDRPRPAVLDDRGASLSLVIDPTCTGHLREFAKGSGDTLQVVLMSAFATLIGSYVDQEDIVLGTLVSGRSRAVFRKTIGYFSNPVPLYLQVSPSLRFGDFQNRVKTKIAGALDHQDYPFPLLVKKLRLVRDPSRTPLFQIMFVHQQMDSSPQLAPCVLSDQSCSMSLGSWELASVPMEKRVSRYDLTLYLIESGDALRGHFLYNPGLFDRSTIRSLSEKYQWLLSRLPDFRDVTWRQLKESLNRNFQFQSGIQKEA